MLTLPFGRFVEALRAARTVIVALACLSFADSAAAQNLTWPSNSTVSAPIEVTRGSTVTITWTIAGLPAAGGPGPYSGMLVNLGYSDPAQTINTTIVSGTQNDGSFAWKIPIGMACGKVVRLWTQAVDPTSKAIVSTWAGNANFLKVTCPTNPVANGAGDTELATTVVDASITPISPTSLIVTKTVVNNTGRPTGTIDFDIDVTCGRDFSRRITLTDGGQETLTGIANGALCTIKESPPPAPAGCAWTTTYPKGTAVRVGTSARPGGPGAQQSSIAAPRLDVVNTLTCKGGTGGAFGSLTIEKQIVVLGSIPPPVMPFTVDVACSPGGPSLPVTLDSGNGYRATVPGIPPGSSCSFTERKPVVPLNDVQRDCSWSVAYPNGKTVGIPPQGQSALRRIVNTWRCVSGDGGPTGGGGEEGGDKGGKTGSLTIIKEVINDSPTIPPVNTSFTVVVTCQPGSKQTVVLNVGNGFRVTLSGLPQGAICTITEQPPVVPSELSRRCRWVTTYPAGQKAEVTDRRDLTIKVRNQWVCGTAS